MCASPFRLLRAGPPPPKVALLPDGLFFVRAVPIAAGATASEAAAQAELALEAAAPFPLAQLFHGSYWLPGAERALVFAAYRRRFTAEQLAEWEGAELVLPAFAAVLGAPVEPATTLLLAAPEGLTAVHWETPGVPTQVRFEPLAPEATDEDRASAKECLLRPLPGSKHVIELSAAPAAEPAARDGEIVFRSGELTARLPATVAAAVDVRDKAELAALRSARKRDVLLWRVTLGAAAALVALGLGELALMGGKQWLQLRQKELNARKPLVEKITGLHELANRIDEIATKRLLPIEMVDASASAKPDEIVFTQAVADRSRGLHTLVVQGTTASPDKINAYEAALRGAATVQSAVASIRQMQNDRTRFELTIVFKPDALKPLQPPAAAGTP
jgi:hypothetical protein